MTASNDEIANGWIAYYMRNAQDQRCGDLETRDKDADWWAVDAVMDLQFDDPLRVLEIVFIIARRTHDDWVLTNLGAGPLEDLLADDPTLLDAIAIETTSSPRLKEALGHVWQNRMSDETYAALQRLARA